MATSRAHQSRTPAGRRPLTRRSARWLALAVRFLPVVVLAAAAIALVARDASAGTVRGSLHDLSTPSDWDQVCAFCHTPHFANPILNAPLWNRSIVQTKIITPYQSGSMDTTPGNPYYTISALCLGCHDGSVGYAVVGSYSVSDKHDLVNAPGPGGIPDTTSWPNCQRCHPDFYGGPPPRWQGTDLSNDHPIAMTYPTSAQDPAFHVPPDLQSGWADVKLYAGKVECPTCHEPHDPDIVPFMRRSNVASGLCLTCHVK